MNPPELRSADRRELTAPTPQRSGKSLTIGAVCKQLEREFPEISISRREGTVRGTGAVNGGGEKVHVQTTSGTIRLRRGPAAGK